MLDGKCFLAGTGTSESYDPFHMSVLCVNPTDFSQTFSDEYIHE